jgi:hypothetical protein
MLLVGFDPRLRRRVWLHELPEHAACGAARSRSQSTCRLRWLNGRRTATEAGDAYEALDGVPFIRLLDMPRPWRLVRPWLADLAREIDAGLTDGSLAGLALDHLWMTHEGRAKLLDFRVPGAPVASAPTSPASVEWAQTFLSEVATSALAGQRSANAVVPRARDPLLLSASALLDTLARRGFATWSDVVSRTTALMNGPDRVERWRRAMSVALCAAVPGFLAVTTVVALRFLNPVMARAFTPEIEELAAALDAASTPRNGQAAVDRTALETYIAGRFGPTITAPRVWADPMTAALLGRHRRLAERIVTDHPRVSAEEMAGAMAALRPFLRRQARLSQAAKNTPLTMVAISFGGFCMMCVAFFGVVWALVFRGGLLIASDRHRRGHSEWPGRLETAGVVARVRGMGRGRRGRVVGLPGLHARLRCAIAAHDTCWCWHQDRPRDWRGGDLSDWRHGGGGGCRTRPARSGRRHVARAEVMPIVSYAATQRGQGHERDGRARRRRLAVRKNTDLLQNRQWICWSKNHPGLPAGSQLVCRRSSRLYWRR